MCAVLASERATLSIGLWYGAQGKPDGRAQDSHGARGEDSASGLAQKTWLQLVFFLCWQVCGTRARDYRLGRVVEKQHGTDLHRPVPAVVPATRQDVVALVQAAPNNNRWRTKRYAPHNKQSKLKSYRMAGCLSNKNRQQHTLLASSRRHASRSNSEVSTKVQTTASASCLESSPCHRQLLRGAPRLVLLGLRRRRRRHVIVRVLARTVLAVLAPRHLGRVEAVVELAHDGRR